MALEARALPALLAFVLLPCRLPAGERWKMQFFYDKADSVLQLNDLQCPSAKRCVASGLLTDKRGREKGAIVRTSDGGEHWSLEEVGERPSSIFLLNDTLGWMVTNHAIWITDDGGQTWEKQIALKGILRAHFLNREHGFAIGYPRAVYETVDGGKKWSKLEIAVSQPTATANTVYDCIAFSGDHGVIIGKVAPRQDDRDPIWLNPNAAHTQQQHESTSIMLETLDGGQHWSASANPAFGDVTQMFITKDGFALALVEYHDYYSLPSRVLKVEFGVPKPLVVFDQADRAVSDIVPLDGGGALLAAIQPPGNSNQVPIPAKLRMVRSENLRDWMEDDVDYRAVASRAVVAAPDRNHAWVATDTGMILALVDTGTPAR